MIICSTENYVVQSFGGKEGNRSKFLYALLHIQVAFYN
jgi:hypothetical protein